MEIEFPLWGLAALGYKYGWTGFLLKPGTACRDCRVCAARCEVLRGVMTYGSIANLFAQRKEPHDFFYCPWIARRWHIRLARVLSGERRRSHVF